MIQQSQLSSQQILDGLYRLSHLLPSEQRDITTGVKVLPTEQRPTAAISWALRWQG